VFGDYMQMKAINFCFDGGFTGNGAAFGRSISNNDPIFFQAWDRPGLGPRRRPQCRGRERCLSQHADFLVRAIRPLHPGRRLADTRPDQRVRRQGTILLTFELNDGHIGYALGINAQREMAVVRRLIERNTPVDPVELADPTTSRLARSPLCCRR
jgi:Reductase C-terminal